MKSHLEKKNSKFCDHVLTRNKVCFWYAQNQDDLQMPGGIMKRFALLLVVLVLILPAPFYISAQSKIYVKRILFFSDIEAKTQSELRTQTSQAQAQAVSLLEDLKSSNDVSEFTPFWIQNAISVKATIPALEAVIEKTGASSVDDVTIKTETRHSAKTDPEWNLKAIGATDVWQTGNKGKGVTIGVLDSGCDITHPELKGKVSNFAYFDEYGRKGQQTVAFDADGHGTMVSSIIAGNTVGVAPESNLIVGCVLPGGSGNLSQIIAGIQWMADPDDNPETKDYPVAVNMSFGMQSVEEYLRPSIDNLVDLGILPIASIGNDGEGSTSNPGNIPEVLAVGSVNSSLKPSSFSSGDEVVWETFDSFSTVIKPDVTAPGEGVRVASLRKTYDIADGTSFSAPHVAGMAALIGAQNPGIGLDDLKCSITETVTDLGKKGWDSRFGMGLVNVKAAISQTSSRKPRTIKISRPSDKPIYGNVTVKTSDRTYSITPAIASNFTFLASDDSAIQISAFGFKPAQTTNDFIELEPLPVHKVTISTMSPLLGGFTESSILIEDSPLEPLEASDGTLVLGLPEGKHTFLITSFGHSSMKVEKDITSDTDFTVNLEPAKLGFIDGRRSYFGMKPVPIRGKLKPALDSTGLPWFYWSLSSGKVTANQLSRFPYLIWNAGGTLDTKEISILSQYLDGGGKLVLTSSFFGASYFGETETTPFLASYFHCTGLEDGGMTIKWSKQGNFRSLALTTLWGFASSSRLSPVDSKAKPFLSYAGNEATTYAGLIVSTPKTQGIILGFTFPDISSIDDAKWLMKLCVDSFEDTISWQSEVTDRNGKPLSGSVKVSGENVPFTDGQLLVPHIPATGAQVIVSSFGSSSTSLQISPANLPDKVILEPAKNGQVKINLNTDAWLLFEDVPVQPKKVQAQSALDLPEGSYQMTIAARNFRPRTLTVKVPGNLDVQLDKKESKILINSSNQRLTQAIGALKLPFEIKEDATAGDIISSQAFVCSASTLPNAKTTQTIEDIKLAASCGANAIVMGQGLAFSYGDQIQIDSSSTPVFSVAGQGILNGLLISTSLKDSGYQVLGVPVISGGETIASFIGIGGAIIKLNNVIVSAFPFEMIDLDVVAAETLRRMLGSMGIKGSLPQGKILPGTNPSKTSNVTISGIAVPMTSSYLRIDGVENIISLDPEGFFTYQANLAEGSHKIEIYSKSEGQVSISQPFNLVVDMTPPKIKIWSPRGGAIATSEVELIATIEGAATISIDGAASKAEGKLFRTKISAGSGLIFIEATDEAGNRSERTATYNFRPTFSLDSKNSGFWYEINQISASGICEQNDAFNPEKIMTRFEAAQWIFNMLELSSVPGKPGYTDIPESSKYAGVINSLAKNGIISGKGKFQGEQSCVREFIVAMLANSFKTKKTWNTTPFSDIPSSNPYFRIIAKAVGIGIINPTDTRLFSGGKFGVGQKVKRSQASALAYNTLSVLAKGE